MSTINLVFFGLSIAGWLFGLVVLLLVAGIGGGVSHLVGRLARLDAVP